MITLSGNEGKMLLQHEFAEMGSFTNGCGGCSGVCQNFRSALKAFLDGTQDIGNVLYNMPDNAAYGTIVNHVGLKSLIDMLPGYSLFPLYCAF